MASQLLIPLLTFVAVMALGGATLAARAARREALRARVAAGIDDLFHDGKDAQENRPILGTLRWLGTMAAPTGPSAALREQLARAGHFSQSAAAVFIGAKLVLLVTGLFVGIWVVSLAEIAGANQFIAVGMIAGIAFFMPNVVLSIQRRQRAAKIRNHLPDMIDLLEICVTAGMGLDMAWNAVGDEIRRVSPLLADEMALANLEMHLGASRAQSMRHMADRTGADDLFSLVAVLVQSERFGTSLSEALSAFATSMRKTRSQRAEEHAEKSAVKLLVPLVLFVFPPMVIITAGPAVLKIIEALEL